MAPSNDPPESKHLSIIEETSYFTFPASISPDVPRFPKNTLVGLEVNTACGIGPKYFDSG